MSPTFLYEFDNRGKDKQSNNLFDQGLNSSKDLDDYDQHINDHFQFASFHELSNTAK